jgi:hypothetical protein
MADIEPATDILFEAHPHFLSLRSGITTGIGVAATIEWHRHFGAARDVPFWETVLVASSATTMAMWSTFLALNTVHWWWTRR